MNTDWPAKLSELFFGTTRLRVMKLLLLHPREALHLREIARLTETQPGTVRRELEGLTSVNVLRRSAVGNQVRYRADTACPIYSELVELLRKLQEGAYSTQAGPVRLRVAERSAPVYEATSTGQEKPGIPLRRLSVSRADLAAVCRRHEVRKLSLFGSVTRDDFRPDSDVDVLVEFTRGEPAGLGRLVDLRDELGTLFGGRTVDVVTRAALTNPHRRRAIVRDQITVYEAHRS